MEYYWSGVFDDNLYQFFELQLNGWFFVWAFLVEFEFFLFFYDIDYVVFFATCEYLVELVTLEGLFFTMKN